MSPQRRRSVRLRFHDYAGGLYLVTACTYGRRSLFGHVEDGAMVRSPLGEVAHAEWLRTEEVRPAVVLDAFVVMPDHVHLLFGIMPQNDKPNADSHGEGRGVSRYAPTAGLRRFESPSKTVGAVVRGYKGAVTVAVNRLRGTPGRRVWQRGFYDRVVRSEREAEAVRRYVSENPARWAFRDPGRLDGHRG